MTDIKFSNVRSDTDDLFSQSGMFDWKEVKQTPYLALLVDERGDVTVNVLTKHSDMLRLPDDTKLVISWKGNWRSDFFHFSVGEARQYLTEHPKSWM